MKNQLDQQAYECVRNGVEASGISRREFIRHAVALGVSVPAAGAIWSGRATAQEPRRGGIFRAGIGDANTSDSLDPGVANGTFSIQLGYAMRSYLTEITSENEIGPDAAESWEASPDAKVWRFKLYPGQTFHNGKPVTSEDVVASLMHHVNPDSGSAARALLADVEDISAEGDLTVVITLKQGNADLPYILTDYHLPVMPSDGAGGADWKSGVGSGPYKLDDFQPGVVAELSRHEGYHRDDQAFFDGLKLEGINDIVARQNALMNGDLDAISSVDLKTLHLLEKHPKIAIDEVSGGTHNGMPMNCNKAPFDNPEARKALKYAINRQEIVDKILFGHGTVAADQPISPGMPYFADIEPRPYDPEKAKFLLDKAGLGGMEVTLSTGPAAGAGAVDMAVLYQQQAKAAGIDLQVAQKPADGYWSEVWLHDPFVMVNTGKRPTPDMMFSLFYKSGAAWNDTNWENARFQELLVQAKTELDDAKRGEMYAEMQRLCSEEGGTVIPFFSNIVTARSKNVVHGDSISSAWELDGGRAYQRWWFES